LEKTPENCGKSQAGEGGKWPLTKEAPKGSENGKRWEGVLKKKGAKEDGREFKRKKGQKKELQN